MKKLNWFSGPLGLVFFFMLVVVIVWFIYHPLEDGTAPEKIKVIPFSVTTTSTVTEPRFESVSARFSRMHIIDETEAFLMSLRKSDGGYFYRKDCFNNSSCIVREDEFYVTAHPWAILAYSGLYKIKKEIIYLDLIQKEIKKINEYLNSPNAQQYTFYWGLVQIYEAYKTNPSTELLDLLLGQGENLRAWRYGYRTYDDTENPMLTAVEAREFAILYKLLGDDENVERLPTRKYMPTNDTELIKERVRARYLNLSVTALESAERTIKKKDEVLLEKENVTLYSDSCWLLLAKLELYDATGDRTWFDDIESYLDVIDFSSSIENDSIKFNIVTEIQPCIDTLLRVYKVSGGKKVILDALALEKYLLDKSWDPDGLSECSGDNGFLSMVSYSTKLSGCGGNAKVHTDNAYSIYLFSETEEQTFNVTKLRRVE